MDVEGFREWLDAYGRAWETRDADAVVMLFTDDAEYRETPFDEPARGGDGIRSYWEREVATQDDVTFEHDVLAVADDTGFARWRATYRRPATGTRFLLDGVFVIGFAADGRARDLREWWFHKELGP